MLVGQRAKDCYIYNGEIMKPETIERIRRFSDDRD